MNDAPARQVYVIQLDQNVQFESQAIPLHILENKHGQPLEFFVEPQVPVADNICQKQEYIDVYGSKIEIGPSVINTLDAINTLDVTKTDGVPDYISNQYTTLKLDGSLPLIPIGIKKELTPATTTEAVQILNNKNELKPSSRVKIKNYVHISDTRVLPRAFAVLPSVLHFRGKLILPRRTISANVRFGPVQGIRKIITKSEATELLKSSDPTAPVFLLTHNEEHVIHIDVTDKDKSNWLGLLPLGQESFMASPASSNVWIYEENNELYALTGQPIRPRVPLKIGYSKKYCEDHGIARPGLDLETVNSIQWWCNECNKALASAALLKRHTDVYHKITINSNQRNYRCKYCRRPFGARFSLKRHMSTHCTKRPKKSTDDKSSQPTDNQTTEADINAVLEDSRIPSDESFQNFTTSLDFSTNLFDTDRMAGLDLSGHSRAEELNPYAIGFRDDNDLGFANGSEAGHNDEANQDNNTPMLETCSYCNQVLAKESKNKHLRQCPSRLICECGRVFRHKKSLAIHVHKVHPNSQYKEKTDDENTKKEDTSETAYKCQECPLGFKRRGMLVNHLWRIHKLISTMPVEKKVKHYPCVACPRIYCSASKRDIHVRVHHPGAEIKNRRCIEGGVRSCQPASCSECPRQYTTRAKLLQHIRAQHPLLAKSMYGQQLEQKAKSKFTTNNKKREGIDKTNSAQLFTEQNACL